ncbi:MAG: hypothetical protein ABJN42_08570, partial [Roseibium sp.]|uniref:hypothetical protein n=1 Tax=Roseibium sp. TaxID=1936156 RepID=UPI0032991C78
DDVDPSQIFGGPAFKDNGDPVEPGDVKKPSRKPMPQSLTSIIQNMVNSAVEDDEDDQTDSDEDAEAGNFWDFEEGQSSGWGGRDPDKVIGAGDIITYRKLTDMEGVPPKSILLREVDRPVDPLQIERSINLDAKTVQTYQRAGKALLGAAVGEHVMLDIPGQDPVTIEILSLMKPEKK